jgi:WXG100 family type VII secretion target
MVDIENAHIVIPIGLDDAPRALRYDAKVLQDELDDLAKLLAPIHEDWTGQAGAAYQHVQDRWNADATALFDPEVGLLGQIADALQKVADNYHLGEKFNVRTWGSFD